MSTNPFSTRMAVNLGIAISALFIGLVPVHAMTMGEREFVCPIDGKKFMALTAFSGTQFGMGLDLKPLGPTPAPWPLPKCPGNGFVLYKKEFSTEELDRLKSYVKGGDYQSMAKIHTNYFLAAKLKAAMGEPVSSVAITLLRATWEARSLEEYQTYASAALATYEQILSAIPQDLDEKLTATLVAGELERRLGLFEKSRTRFLGIPNRTALRSPMNEIVQLQLVLIEKMNSEPAEVPSK